MSQKVFQASSESAESASTAETAEDVQSSMMAESQPIEEESKSGPTEPQHSQKQEESTPKPEQQHPSESGSQPLGNQNTNADSDSDNAQQDHHVAQMDQAQKRDQEQDLEMAAPIESKPITSNGPNVSTDNTRSRRQYCHIRMGGFATSACAVRLGIRQKTEREVEEDRIQEQIRAAKAKESEQELLGPNNTVYNEVDMKCIRRGFCDFAENPAFRSGVGADIKGSESESKATTTQQRFTKCKTCSRTPKQSRKWHESIVAYRAQSRQQNKDTEAAATQGQDHDLVELEMAEVTQPASPGSETPKTESEEQEQVTQTNEHEGRITTDEQKLKETPDEKDEERAAFDDDVRWPRSFTGAFTPCAITLCTLCGQFLPVLDQSILDVSIVAIAEDLDSDLTSTQVGLVPCATNDETNISLSWCILFF